MLLHSFHTCGLFTVDVYKSVPYLCIVMNVQIFYIIAGLSLMKGDLQLGNTNLCLKSTVLLLQS